jgi:hypothetical protein
MLDIRCIAIDKTGLPGMASPAIHGVEKRGGANKKAGHTPGFSDSKRLAYL